MDNASEAIFGLKPVTFRYKRELDPSNMLQFGLVAEEVAKVNPDLVVRDRDGKPYTVRYEAVNAMLLSEFLKEHHRVEAQRRQITALKSRVAKQETLVAEQQKQFQATVAREDNEIRALTSSLKEQAAQIQKVSARIEINVPATKLAGASQ
jgi:septal ring factor EnvC (AmiA/AmiB activator)